MPALRNDIDPDGLLEYSVVFTDRSLNHMSARFRNVMCALSEKLKAVYAADAVAIVPGGGTYAMEAVARQVATGAKVLVVRNGWFSFRWSQILDAGGIPAETIVLNARPTAPEPQPAFAPPPIDQVTAAIAAERPEVVFAPHVETSAGVILPDAYLKAMAEAAHAVGAIFVLDCVASGCVWIDMAAIGVDILITAPQKGWSASPCAGLVMMSAAGRDRVTARKSTSFACDLGKWLSIMQAYEAGGHAYHATMPTDGLATLHAMMEETEAFGFAKIRDAQWALGGRLRAELAARGYRSVAAEDFAAPSVIVCHTADPAMKTGAKLAAHGVQVAAGVPLEIGEPEGYASFRIGLFGLDKLKDVDAAAARLLAAIDALEPAAAAE